MPKFSIRSSAFEEGKAMPSRYAHRGVQGGQNISVPLAWDNPPPQTKSFALACVDLHPVANKWIHWLVANIPAGCRSLPEGCSMTGAMPKGSMELKNTYGDQGYGGPQPPTGTGPHKYEFSLYALNVDTLQVSPQTSLSAFMKALEGKILGAARLTGIFER